MREVPDIRTADFLEAVREPIERELDRILPPATEAPVRLHEAMRYSVFAGGKRLRPALCIAGFITFRPEWEPILPVAAAIELIHTYSLVHDDLPAMDDDDVRRGRPSCHRRFGEATAILTGDALLTLAFECLSSAKGLSADLLRDVTARISRAAGSSGGMIAGQVLDLEAAGNAVSGARLQAIHESKTGALLEVALVSGAVLGGASSGAVAALERFGRAIGLAFQVTDDILDEVASPAALGKTPGKDARQGKATYPGLYGIEASYVEVRRLTAEARGSLKGLGQDTSLLAGIADHLETRTH